ncbi:helix-turn-helix transcriptional regulator [Lachnospiraceae bacterium ZAX-1]
MITKINESERVCDVHCPCAVDCPLNKAMNIIGGKWKTAILCALHIDGVTRYNALKRKVKGITNTMLASSLKELEEVGLIQRMQYMEMPVRVEYSTTPACSELMPILQQLAQWGRQR